MSDTGKAAVRLAAAIATVLAAVAVVFGSAAIAPQRASAASCQNWEMKSPKLILNLDNGQTAEFDLWQGMFSTHDPNAILNAGATFYGNADGALGMGSFGKIDFTANWQDLEGTHITSHFTGAIADNGTARGTAVDNKNFQVGWSSQGAFSCVDVAPAADTPPAPVTCPDGSTVTPPQSCPVAAPPKNCPDGSSVPAGQPCAPPTDAVKLSFDRSGFDLKATFSNLSKASGTCHYDAEPAGGTAVGNKTDDFPIGANSNVTRTYPGPLPGSTYHVVVSCTGTYDGQNVEFGHIDQDFDF